MPDRHIIIVVAVSIVLALIAGGMVFTTLPQPHQENGQTNTIHSNTFFTACHITGTGGLYLRVLSDSNGTPAQGEKISGVLEAECAIVGATSEKQVIHIDNFTRGKGDWLSPVLPDGAESAGRLNFTVQYVGRTYNFSAGINPASTTCVTLHVPSGNVTTASVFASGDCGTPSTLTVSSCNNTVDVNGTSYCSLNVTNYMNLIIHGYASMSSPIRFMGVLFQTVCPNSPSECSNQSGTLQISVIKFNLIFADGTSEPVTAYIPYAGRVEYLLSTQHLHPRAGFLIEYAPGASTADVELVLLVAAQGK